MGIIRSHWRPQLFLLAICTLLLLANLGATSLWDIDEPRNAGCAAQMYAQGEWIVPTFNGQLRSHKPVLLYWLMMLAYAVFGVNEFAARFWSAVLSIGRRAVWSNILTHEFGHAWHTKFMAEDLTRWGEYAKIRGYVSPTDPIQLYRAGLYTDDWRERFALDFQWAFNPDHAGRFMPKPCARSADSRSCW